MKDFKFNSKEVDLSCLFSSRIQVREAFSLYLYKIQLRLLNESQFKEDTNVQQMVEA